MATYCFNAAAILAVSVMHSSSDVITRDQQAKIADTQTLGKHVERYFFTFLFFGKGFFPLIRQNSTRELAAKTFIQSQYLKALTVRKPAASAFKYCDRMKVLAASLGFAITGK